MKRFLPIPVLAAALFAPQAASARYIELGSNAPAATASCPADCQAVGRVTGYQGRAGGRKSPFLIRRKGVITAFTITLGKPDDNQIRFFEDLYGGPPQVRIAVLQPGKTRRTRLQHTLVAQSRAYRLDEYFGSSPTFVFPRPIPVSRKNVIGITVPTWAPAFAVGLPGSNWWRSSRAKGRCDNVSQNAQQTRVKSVMRWGCTYRTARLQYTVTYVPVPRKSTPAKKSSRR